MGSLATGFAGGSADSNAYDVCLLSTVNSSALTRGFEITGLSSERSRLGNAAPLPIAVVDDGRGPFPQLLTSELTNSASSRLVETVKERSNVAEDFDVVEAFFR